MNQGKKKADNEEQKKHDTVLIVYCFDQNYANNMLQTVKFSPKEGNIFRVSRSMYIRFYLKFRYIICLC